MKGNVQNALAPEETTILENVLSLVQQLLASQGGQTEQPMIAEAEEPNLDDPNQAMELEKAVINENGDTKAEDRLSNQTEITDANISTLGKALQSLLTKKQTVQKANSNNLILNELKKLNATLAYVAKAQQEQDTFNQNIMDALGFSNEVIQKSITTSQQTVQNAKPVQGQDMTLFAKELVGEVIKSLGVQQAQNNPEYNHPFNQKRRYGNVNKANNDNPMHKVIDFIGTHGRAM